GIATCRIGLQQVLKHGALDAAKSGLIGGREDGGNAFSFPGFNQFIQVVELPSQLLRQDLTRDGFACSHKPNQDYTPGFALTSHTALNADSTIETLWLNRSP